MLDIRDGFLLRFEDKGESNANHHRKTSEDEPACLPVANEIAAFPMAEAIHNLASRQSTDGSAQSVGHHHKQSLRRGFDFRITLLVDEDATRHIEEVEGDTIYTTR